MGQRLGFKNIQIQSKQELHDLFEDTMAQSGANSKAEFLRMLLDNYLNPEELNTPSLKSLEEKLSSAQDNLLASNKENQRYTERLALYETDELKSIFQKHEGETVSFNNYQGKKVRITINDLPDVFSAILNSVKIK